MVIKQINYMPSNVMVVEIFQYVLASIHYSVQHQFITLYTLKFHWGD